MCVVFFQFFSGTSSFSRTRNLAVLLSLSANIRVHFSPQSIQKVHLFNTKTKKMSGMGQPYLLPNHTQAALARP